MSNHVALTGDPDVYRSCQLVFSLINVNGVYSSDEKNNPEWQQACKRSPKSSEYSCKPSSENSRKKIEVSNDLMLHFEASSSSLMLVEWTCYKFLAADMSEEPAEDPGVKILESTCIVVPKRRIWFQNWSIRCQMQQLVSTEEITPK